MTPTNFLKPLVLLADQKGIPAELVAVLLLLPLVASFIAFARHFLGIRGFGVFTPAMLAVVLLEVGALRGIVLFLLILAAATIARLLSRGMKIHYLARMALLIWFICLSVFFSLFWIGVSILPVLILILLAENFAEAQISKSLRDASQLTLETMILTLGSFAILYLPSFHRFALLHPEILVLGTLAIDLIIGKFTGLRLLEYRRFKRLLK